MGNCFCVRLFYKRRVLRQYTALDSGTGPVHEAEDLFDADDGDGLMSSAGSSSSTPAITEKEKLLLKSKNYAAIISSQKTFDQQIDQQLAEQEERLKREEEELLKLRRSQQKAAIKQESPSKSSKTDSEIPWSTGEGNSEWNVAGGENDFDMFLDAVSTRDRTPDNVEEEINEDDFVSHMTSGE